MFHVAVLLGKTELYCIPDNFWEKFYLKITERVYYPFRTPFPVACHIFSVSDSVNSTPARVGLGNG